MAVQDVARIEERLDRAKAGATLISDEMGGVLFQNMAEVMEFAKLVSVSGAAVPSHLRGNPGACLAICIQALEWRMSPFAVANKSYLVNNKGEERIAYESQLIHAVIEARSPLEGRLRFEIIGEADERRCKVWGKFKGEAEPHVYISETLAKLRDARGRNEYGKVKGSPLWDSQPEVQLFYSASRQWCRLFAPDVLLGLYTPEELDGEHVGPEKAKEINPKPDIAKRLTRAKGERGFNAEHVERETKPTEPEASGSTTEASAAPEPPGAGATETRPSPQPDAEIAAQDVPDSGVEARAAEPAKPPLVNSGPPSIFQKYADAVFTDGKKDPRVIAQVHKRFFERNLWPEDDELQNKFRRIRAICITHANNEIDDEKAKALVEEAVAS